LGPVPVRRFNVCDADEEQREITLSVDQNDVVEITGEIDRDNRRIEVEVQTIRKI
jgi:uncharacterized protein YdeI (BOF family)